MRDKSKTEIYYDIVYRDYTFVAVPASDGDAQITISKDGTIIKRFLFPAYKIWNIPAHADDIINGLEKQSNRGLYMAGDTLLGGNVYKEGSANE